ncbi:MAG: hypothetical protein LBI04_12570 [Treponema sp.]|jgi:hypothetical protein|nr:hypothetical protein [Treponema sp.]
MKKRFTSFLFAAIFLFSSLSVFAVDFGLVYSQDADISVPAFDFEEAAVDLSGVLTPRFTALVGETGDLYISASVKYHYEKSEPMAIIPELARTDFAFSLGNIDIKAGRMIYSDPLGIVASGLFDGAKFSYISSFGNFHIGGWYTGFLYKEKAAITMTSKEMADSHTKLDYEDFANTYFAPSRILAALEYDHPSLAGGILGLKSSLIAQFDTGDDKLNSQYLAVSLSVPVNSFIFDAGGCFELIEYKDETTPAFAAEFGVTWMLPTVLEKHLKLSGRYSSGVNDDKTIGAFLPLTTVPQGELVEAKFSGLTVLGADFTGRFAKSLSANVVFTYFIRNDLGTYVYYPVSVVSSEEFFLGGEIFGRVILNISTGIRLNIGTGVFMPQMGNAAPDADMLWRTKLNLVLSIF